MGSPVSGFFYFRAKKTGKGWSRTERERTKSTRDERDASRTETGDALVKIRAEREQLSTEQENPHKSTKGMRNEQGWRGMGIVRNKNGNGQRETNAITVRVYGDTIGHARSR